MNMKLSKFATFKLICLVLLVGLLSGCASVFVPYTARVADMRAHTAAGKYQAALTNAKKEKIGDIQLYGPNIARLDQLNGDYKASLLQYAEVIKDVRQKQLGPRHSLKNWLSNAASIGTNDNVIPYRLAGYEVVMLYQYQALNYVALGDMSDALVSIRRAGIAQQTLSQRYHKELLATQKKASSVRTLYKSSQHKKAFEATAELASGVKNSFQNGATYYLSAITYEAMGDYNDAFISIKNALGVAPDNVYVRRKLMEILQQRGAGEAQIAEYKLKFGWLTAPSVPKDRGQLVVFYEQGLVPEKRQENVPIPLVIGPNTTPQIQQIAFPVYNQPYVAPQSLSVRTAWDDHFQTKSVVDFQRLSAKALEEQYPMIFLRSVLRVISKAAMTDQSAKKGNFLGFLIAQIYSIASSVADLRSWLLLPRNIQVMQAYLSVGKHQIRLTRNGQYTTVSVTIRNQKTQLLWVTSIHSKLTVKELTL